MQSASTTVSENTTANPVTAALDKVVAQWEKGMTRVATYKLPYSTWVHIAKTKEGKYWVLCYFIMGIPDAQRCEVSADASGVDAEAAMKAVERRLR